MDLATALRETVCGYLARHGADAAAALAVTAPDCWHLRIDCEPPGLPGLTIRSLAPGDVPALISLGRNLGARSRHLFCPYPWADEAALPGAFAKAIAQATAGIDASYLMETAANGTIGHFFLWRAGGNPHSQARGVQVPELGVAIGDAWQGRGLGGLAVRLLLVVAAALHADAVELTTAMDNSSGWTTYRRCGFEYTGIIRNPLDVDVTAAVSGEVEACRYRDERQMVCLVDGARRQAVLDYLAYKRRAAQG